MRIIGDPSDAVMPMHRHAVTKAVEIYGSTAPVNLSDPRTVKALSETFPGRDPLSLTDSEMHQVALRIAQDEHRRMTLAPIGIGAAAGLALGLSKGCLRCTLLGTLLGGGAGALVGYGISRIVGASDVVERRGS